jgi:hypothetical protein
MTWKSELTVLRQRNAGKGGGDERRGRMPTFDTHLEQAGRRVAHFHTLLF